MLAEEDPARREDPLVRASEVTDQNVEMHGGACGTTPGGRASPAPRRALERKPLAMRRRLSVTQPGYHSTGVPPSRLAQNLARSHGSTQSSTISRIQPIGPSPSSLTSP